MGVKITFQNGDEMEIPKWRWKVNFKTGMKKLNTKMMKSEFQNGDEKLNQKWW